MKKRTFSLLLSLILALGCLSPLCVPAADPADTYPEIDEDAYNALYVQENLIFAADFFSLNEYWGEAAPTLPTAPYLLTEYDYKGTKVDFTVEANRLKYDGSGAATGFSAAYSAAISKYKAELEEILNTFVYVSKTPTAYLDLELEEGETLPITSFGAYLPSYGVNSWNDADGLYQTAGFAFGDGYLQPNRQMTSQYVTFRNIPGTGGFTAQYAGLCDTNGELATIRDIRIHSTAANGYRTFDQVLGYNGLNENKTYNLTSPVKIAMEESASYTLSLFSDRKNVEGAYSTVMTAHINGTEILKDLKLNDNNGGGVPNTLFGYHTTGGRLYAVRYYEGTLTDAQRARNHLADLCKYFRLDITGIDALHENDLGYLAGRLAAYTFTDDRAEVKAVFEGALSYLLEDSIVGSGAAYETFRNAILAGEIDASTVRALPAAYQGEVFTAYANLLASNPTADAATRQAAIEAAVTAVLTTHFGDYYGKTPEVTAEDFFTSTTLSAAAAHFKEVAEANALDLKSLVGVDTAILEHLYASFADVVPSVPSLSAVLQKRLVDTLAAYKERYFGESVIDSLLSFHGYQLTMKGDTGARAVYTVNTDVLAALEAKGYTVTFGSLFTAGSTAPTVKREGNAYVPASDAIKTETVYKTGTGYAGNHFTLLGKKAFAYEYMTNNAQEAIAFSAYAVVERAGEEPVLYYFAAKGANIKTVSVTLKQLASTCSNKNGIVYPNVQKLLARSTATEAAPTVYIDSENLTEFRPVLESDHKTMVNLFRKEIAAATSAPSAMPSVKPEDATGTRLIRFAHGDKVSLTKAADGSLLFTYVKGQEDAAAEILEKLLAVTVDIAEEGASMKLPTCFLTLGELK